MKEDIPMNEQARKATRFLQTLHQLDREEAEAVGHMSEAALDAELAQAGLDFHAVEQRLEAQLAQTEDNAPSPWHTLATGITSGLEGMRRWVRCSREGLEELEFAFGGALMGEAEDEDTQALLAALAEAEIAVVATGLTVEPEGAVQITLRWRRQAPDEPPSVQLFFQGEPLGAHVQWTGWRPEAGWPQHLVLEGVGAEQRAPLTAAALERDLLAYAWDEQRRCLEVQLLPPA